MTATWTGSAWSCTVRLTVEDDRALAAATEELIALLARVDRAASRFRADSALSLANARSGRPVPVPMLLVDLVVAALGSARETDGAVDPALGRTLCDLGYDRDISAVRAGDISAVRAGEAGAGVPAPVRRSTWQRIRLDREAGLLTVPRGAALDLGATAKAWTADRAAQLLAARHDTGVLVELGGDLAVAGHRDGEWNILVAEREGADGQLVRVDRGGLATSTTTVRTWTRGGTPVHHIVDPRTGRPADGPWRTVAVHAPSALAANTASTAAIVRGAGAVSWLTDRGLAARLVDRDGQVVTTAGWPTPELAEVAA